MCKNLVGLLVVFVTALAALFGLAEAQPTGLGEVTFYEVAWSGTGASASDEYFELLNNTPEIVQLQGWRVVITHDDTTTDTVDIEGGDLVSIGLMERTDDLTVSNVAALHTYSGSLSNTGITKLELYDDLGNLQDVIDMPEAIWPAGSSTPRASMQLIDSVWRTSNATFGGLDANGDPIYGTPGEPNQISADPTTCEGGVTGNYSWELVFHNLEEGGDLMPFVEVNVDLYGVDVEGNIVQTDGEFDLIWEYDDPIGRWVLIDGVEYDEETSQECVQALIDLSLNTETYLATGEHFPNNVTHDFEVWLAAVVQFQASQTYGAFLPVNYLP